MRAFGQCVRHTEHYREAENRSTGSPVVRRSRYPLLPLRDAEGVTAQRRTKVLEIQRLGESVALPLLPANSIYPAANQGRARPAPSVLSARESCSCG